MAKTGRPRKPTALRILEGNRSRRPITELEPAPEKIAPRCPKHLQGEQRKEWKRFTKELLGMNVLSLADRPNLEIWCTLYGFFHATKIELDKAGGIKFIKTESGYAMPDPRFGVMKQVAEMMLKISTEFGGTPAARTRIKIEKPPEIDPFEEFRSKKKKA